MVGVFIGTLVHRERDLMNFLVAGSSLDASSLPRITLEVLNISETTSFMVLQVTFLPQGFSHLFHPETSKCFFLNDLFFEEYIPFCPSSC